MVCIWSNYHAIRFALWYLNTISEIGYYILLFRDWLLFCWLHMHIWILYYGLLYDVQWTLFTRVLLNRMPAKLNLFSGTVKRTHRDFSVGSFINILSNLKTNTFSREFANKSVSFAWISDHILDEIIANRKFVAVCCCHVSLLVCLLQRYRQYLSMRL